MEQKDQTNQAWKVSILKVVIEEHIRKPRMYKGRDMTKEMFYLPAIPWQWTLYDGLKIVSMGYAHTEDDANRLANQAINQYCPRRA